MGGAPMASPRAATGAVAASGGAPGGRAPMTFAQRVSAMLAHGSSGGAARSGSIGVGRAGDVRTPPRSDAAMHGRDPTRQGQDDVTTLQYRHQHGGPLLTPLLNTHHQQSQQQDLARELPSSSQQPLAYRHEVTARARGQRADYDQPALAHPAYSQQPRHSHQHVIAPRTASDEAAAGPSPPLDTCTLPVHNHRSGTTGGEGIARPEAAHTNNTGGGVVESFAHGVCAPPAETARAHDCGGGGAAGAGDAGALLPTGGAAGRSPGDRQQGVGDRAGGGSFEPRSHAALAAAVADEVGKRIQQCVDGQERLERTVGEMASSLRTLSGHLNALTDGNSAQAEALREATRDASDALMSCERRHAAVADRLERATEAAASARDHHLRQLAERDTAMAHVLEAHRNAAQVTTSKAVQMQQLLDEGLFLRDSAALCDMVDLVVQRLSRRHNLSVVSGLPPARASTPEEDDAHPPAPAEDASAPSECPLGSAALPRENVGAGATFLPTSEQDGAIGGTATRIRDDRSIETGEEHRTSQHDDDDLLMAPTTECSGELSKEDWLRLQRVADGKLTERTQAEYGRIIGKMTFLAAADAEVVRAEDKAKESPAEADGVRAKDEDALCVACEWPGTYERHSPSRRHKSHADDQPATGNGDDADATDNSSSDTDGDVWGLQGLDKVVTATAAPSVQRQQARPGNAPALPSRRSARALSAVTSTQSQRGCGHITRSSSNRRPTAFTEAAKRSRQATAPATRRGSRPTRKRVRFSL